MYFGCDVGGTKVEVVRFDESFVPVWSDRRPTQDFDPGSLKFLDSISLYLNSVLKPSDAVVGIATKGLVHRGRAVFASLLGGRVQVDLVEEFSRRLARPVRVDNDLRPQLVAELTCGVGANVGSLCLVNLGTGLSVAFAEKQGTKHEAGLLTGYQGMSGQLSFYRQQDARTGQNLSAELLLSGAGFEKQYQELSGESRSAEQIFADSEDSKARTLVGFYIQNLASLLESLSYLYNPEVFVLTGSLTRSARAFLPQVEEVYFSHTDEYSRVRQIVVTTLEHPNCLGIVLPNWTEFCAA